MKLLDGKGRAIICVTTMMMGCMAIGKAQAQAISYDNTASWNGSSALQSWGTPTGYSTSYGEIFAAPSLGGVTLDTFTFFVEELATTGDTIHFQANVYSWNNSSGTITGPALFSQNLSFTDNGTLQAVTVNTGGVNLTPGENYIAFFTSVDSASVAANGNNDLKFVWGWLDPSAANGDSATWNNGATSSDWNSMWDGGDGYGAFVWQATFSAPPAPTPEPATLALIGTGAMGLFIVRRRSAK